jgi:hypothetical protein
MQEHEEMTVQNTRKKIKKDEKHADSTDPYWDKKQKKFQDDE